MAVVNRKDEEKQLGWGILALYGVIAIPFLRLLSTISLKTQFVAITAIEFLLLAVWISFLNRTTPNKSEKLTRFMGNLVLALLGISVVIVIAGAYVEGSSAMAVGLLFLIILLMGASYYFLGDIIGDEEKKGRTPRIETLPIGFGIFLFAYPTIVAFLVSGWKFESAIVISTAGRSF